jgi:hypothetical protein
MARGSLDANYANVIDNSEGFLGYFTMENVPGGSLDKFWHSYGVEFGSIRQNRVSPSSAKRGLN